MVTKSLQQAVFHLNEQPNYLSSSFALLIFWLNKTKSNGLDGSNALLMV